MRHAVITNAPFPPLLKSTSTDFSPPAVLCAILNRLLAQNDRAKELLAQHAGRGFEIQAQPIQAKLAIDSDGTLRPAGANMTPQVCLTLDVTALLKMGWRPGQPMPEQSGLLHVSGDVAMAQTLSTLAKHWRPDLEDLLAQRIGDIAARQVYRGAQSFIAAVWRSTQRLAENVAEYAAHENGSIAAAGQLDALVADHLALSKQLSDLDDRLQQLQQRVNRLAGSDPL